MMWFFLFNQAFFCNRKKPMHRKSQIRKPDYVIFFFFQFLDKPLLNIYSNNINKEKSDERNLPSYNMYEEWIKDNTFKKIIIKTNNFTYLICSSMWFVTDVVSSS